MSRATGLLCTALLASASATSLLSLRGGAIKLKTDDDKALYALGCNVGRQVGDLDCFSPDEIDRILVGVKDTLTRTEHQVDLMEFLPKVAELFKVRQAAHIEKIEVLATETLAKAAKEEGAEKTASGLVIKHLKDGDGEMPTADSTVKVHYTGTLPDGSVFDDSIKRGEPVEFKLTDVVPGWQEGIAMMKVGGKAKLTLPAALGYGDEGRSTIPPKSALVFEVELLAIVSSASTTAAAGADTDDSAEPEDDVTF